MTEKKTTTTAQKQPDGIITTQRNGQTINNSPAGGVVSGRKELKL